MLSLNLPEFDAKIVFDGKKKQIFDVVRQRYVALTPEEWVRQHFVNYVTAVLRFPASLIANEKGLKVNGVSRRCDTLIYTRNLRPLCVIEYKRSTVEITSHVFEQIARYNSVLTAPFLIVSNGLKHYCARLKPTGYEFLREIPSYEDMCRCLE